MNTENLITDKEGIHCFNFIYYDYKFTGVYDKEPLFVSYAPGNNIFTSEELAEYGVLAMYIYKDWAEKNKELIFEVIKQLKHNFKIVF